MTPPVIFMMNGVMSCGGWNFCARAGKPVRARPATRRLRRFISKSKAMRPGLPLAVPSSTGLPRYSGATRTIPSVRWNVGITVEGFHARDVGHAKPDLSRRAKPRAHARERRAEVAPRSSTPGAAWQSTQCAPSRPWRRRSPRAPRCASPDGRERRCRWRIRRGAAAHAAGAGRAPRARAHLTRLSAGRCPSGAATGCVCRSRRRPRCTPPERHVQARRARRGRPRIRRWERAPRPPSAA